MASTCSLVLFTKSARAANAKTRLKSAFPEQEAFIARLHEAFVQDALVLLQNLPELDRYVYWYDKGDALPTSSSWTSCYQEGASFTDRFINCLREVSSKTNGAVLVIGSDCPLISASIISQAAHAARTGHLVLGPSGQGGFYLLGLARDVDPSRLANCFSDGFENVNVAKAFPEHELSLLPFLSDVDQEEDLIELIAQIQLRQRSNREYIPSCTAEVLEGLDISGEIGSSRKKKIIWP